MIEEQLKKIYDVLTDNIEMFGLDEVERFVTMMDKIKDLDDVVVLFRAMKVTLNWSGHSSEYQLTVKFMALKRTTTSSKSFILS